MPESTWTSEVPKIVALIPKERVYAALEVQVNSNRNEEAFGDSGSGLVG